MWEIRGLNLHRGYVTVTGSSGHEEVTGNGVLRVMGPWRLEAAWEHGDHRGLNL